MSGLMLPGNAQSGDVRYGKTFTAGNNYDATGTLADNGSPSAVAPSTATQTLAAGIYDSAITINPIQGTATTADVLPSVTFSSGTVVNGTGTMATVTGGNTITPGQNNQTAIAGSTYAENAITVAGSSSLVASNILKGASIFGVAGSVGRSASGTATSSSTSVSYYGYENSTSGQYYAYSFTVSGLAFQPSYFLVWSNNSNGAETALYVSTNEPAPEDCVVTGGYTTSGTAYATNISNDHPGYGVCGPTSDGFVCPFQIPNAPVYWMAWED